MKKYLSALSCSVLMIMAVVSLKAGAAEHPFAHQISPEYYSVLLENERVRVLQMVLPPGAKDRVHRHDAETVYFKQGGQLTITLPDGTANTVDIEDGFVMWHDAWVHKVTNSGNQDVIAIIVEQKLSVRK